MKNQRKVELKVRVRYADNPAESEAALNILRTGFRRGLTKLAAETARKIAKDGVA